MGWRFRRSLKILPGMRLNLSRSGVSTSIGVRGAHVTVGHGKVRETVGLPGSGISYTHVENVASNALLEAAHPVETPTESTKGKAWREWLWILLFAVFVAAVVYGFAKAATPSADDVLLKAINFALTGSDRIFYSFANRGACIVNHAQPSTQDGVQAVETFYLNNIDLTRASWQEKQSTTIAFGTTRSIRVELHGETTIRSNGFIPASAILTATDVTLDLNTTERDRLIRAWHYIYAHGCKSAQSSY